MKKFNLMPIIGIVVICFLFFSLLLIFPFSSPFDEFKSEVINDEVKSTTAVKNTVDTITEQKLKKEWQKFYEEEFGLKTDFSKVKIPANPSDFDRVIILPKGLSYKTILLKMTEKFSVYLFEDDYNYYDANVKSVRTNDKDYAVRVRNRVEADTENKNLSTNDLEERKNNGITLKERFIYELKYFKETNNHLDIDNWTLCSGSRYSDGNVPKARWYSDEFYVDWYYAGHSFGHLSSRSAVS